MIWLRRQLSAEFGNRTVVSESFWLRGNNIDVLFRPDTKYIYIATIIE